MKALGGMKLADIKKFEFPKPLPAQSSRVFPEALETDEHVFFHGTLAVNLDKIVAEGFKPAKSLESGDLTSVSFSKQSPMALSFLCQKQSTDSQDGAIIAVRYERLDFCHIKVNLSDMQDYRLDPPPEIIGYCIVPSEYPAGW
jgi:hypothetical protein